jgi:hypothetical protein
MWPLNGGSVSLFIVLGSDLGTPKFQDNRVCRFQFSMRLEKIGENSWESGFLPFPPCPNRNQWRGSRQRNRWEQEETDSLQSNTLQGVVVNWSN